MEKFFLWIFNSSQSWHGLRFLSIESNECELNPHLNKARFS